MGPVDVVVEAAGGVDIAGGAVGPVDVLVNAMGGVDAAGGAGEMGVDPAETILRAAVLAGPTE